MKLRIRVESELKLLENISIFDLGDMEDIGLTIGENEIDRPYYILNNKKYYPIIEIFQTTDERQLKLFRIHVKITDNENKTLSEVYDYINLWDE